MSETEIENRPLSSPENNSDADDDEKSKGALNMIKCEECGLTCAGKSHYNVHIRSHTGERPYVCHICGFGFTQKGNLRRHYKIHSDEKPYECPLCSYKCRRRDALNGHMRIHSDQRPYRCSFCDRSYKSRQSMKEHEYQCPFKTTQQERKTIQPLSSAEIKPHQTPKFPSFPMMRFSLPNFQNLASNYLQPNVSPLFLPGLMMAQNQQKNDRIPNISLSGSISAIDKDSGISEEKAPIESPKSSTFSLKSPEPEVKTLESPRNPHTPTSQEISRKRSRTPDSPEPDFSHSKKLKIEKPSAKKPEISVEVEKTTSDGSEDAKSEGGCSHQSSEDSSIENIKVFRNGNQLEIWTCDICKCIFLDKAIYSIHMGAHVQQTVMKWQKSNRLQMKSS